MRARPDCEVRPRAVWGRTAAGWRRSEKPRTLPGAAHVVRWDDSAVLALARRRSIQEPMICMDAISTTVSIVLP